MARLRTKSMDLRLVISIKLDDYEIGMVREVVCTAETKVSRVSPPHGSIGQLGGRVREDVIPPLEKPRWIACW